MSAPHPRTLRVRPDAPYYRAVARPLVELLAGGSATTVPDAFDLSIYEGPLLDQGQSGACTAAATSGGLSLIDRARVADGLPALLGFDPSPAGLYRGSRELERAALIAPGTVGVPLPALEDTGASLGVAVSVPGIVGVRPMLAPTPDGRTFDLWTAADTQGMVLAPGVEASNVDDDTLLGDLETSLRKLAVGTYGIDPTTAGAELAIKQAMVTQRTPAIMSTFVDSQVMDYTASSTPVGAPNQSDPNGGGHAMLVVGWVSDGVGGWLWRIRNSWGTWGQTGGHMLARSGYLAAAWNLYMATYRAS